MARDLTGRSNFGLFLEVLLILLPSMTFNESLDCLKVIIYTSDVCIMLIIRNLFPVEAMLWQLRMHNNDHEHADRIRTVILEAD